MQKDMLRKNFNIVEKYLNGIRKSNRFCATIKAADIIKKVYSIDLDMNEAIDKKLGLYMFSIIKKDEKNSS